MFTPIPVDVVKTIVVSSSGKYELLKLMYCCMRRVWSDCRVYICNQDVTMDERAGPSTSSTSTPPLPEAYIEGPSTSAPPFPPPTHASPLRCRPHRCTRAAASVSLHAAVAHRFHSRCCRRRRCRAATSHPPPTIAVSGVIPAQRVNAWQHCYFALVLTSSLFARTAPGHGMHCYFAALTP